METLKRRASPALLAAVTMDIRTYLTFVLPLGRTLLGLELPREAETGVRAQPTPRLAVWECHRSPVRIQLKGPGK